MNASPLPNLRISNRNPSVAVIIVNWNRWKDTIKCFKTVCGSNYTDYRVVICDNHSSDDSHERLQSFLKAGFSPIEKKRFSTIDLFDFKSRIDSFQIYGPHCTFPWSQSISPDIVLLRTKINLGFAAGNNTAIIFAKRWFAPNYYWILNNDTWVISDALPSMIDRMVNDRKAGICGSTLLSMDGKIQTLGGYRFLKWAGTGAPIYAGCPRPSEVMPGRVEAQMDYVAGASMLVSRDFIETVGLMDESYFLYFEEIDWARRARGRFKFLYAPNSIVYHREGGTIGSSGDGNRRSEKSFYWICRSRVRFTARHHPEALPTVLAYSVMNALLWTFRTGKRSIFTHSMRGIADAFIKRCVLVAG